MLKVLVVSVRAGAGRGQRGLPGRAGVKARSLPLLLHRPGELVSNPGRLTEMAGRARAISRPHAARTVTERQLNCHPFWDDSLVVQVAHKYGRTSLTPAEAKIKLRRISTRIP